MKIETIDKNLVVNTTVNEPDIVYYDVRRDPFDVYGLYNYRTEPEFKRMPDDVAASVSDGVKVLAKHTAGGRVRFCTDSQYVAIHMESIDVAHFTHAATTGVAGFDLYLDDPVIGKSIFRGEFVPPYGYTGGYDQIIRFPDRHTRYLTVNMPTYSNVKNLYVGLQKDATLDHGLKYIDMDPIVYYGSSITQGGCANKPGSTYQAIVNRNINIDYLNLGFSGSAKAEDTMVEYLAGLPMSVFVCDYDHNAPNPEHLFNTHEKLYKRVRETHPDIPIIFVTKPDFYNGADEIRRRFIVFETYRKAFESGDKNVYFVDGESFFRGYESDLCTVEGCHPTDAGFAKMGEALTYQIIQALIKR